MGGEDVVVVVEALYLDGAPQDDVHPSAIGLPPRQKSLTAEELVRMVDAPVVLQFELVLGSGRVGIALPPEGFHEALPLLHRLERKENLTLPIEDDINGFLFQPLAVLGRKTFHLIVLSGASGKRTRIKGENQQKA